MVNLSVGCGANVGRGVRREATLGVDLRREEGRRRVAPPSWLWILVHVCNLPDGTYALGNARICVGKGAQRPRTVPASCA